MITPYSKIHFGKSFDETITADDVIDYFAVERDESLTLEFKSYYPKDKPDFDGVLRTIAAFLNSEGGLLIYGAPAEVPKGEKYRVVKGEPTPIPTTITTKDSLIRRISDNISYMPTGILIKPIEMASGGFVYIIEVQESAAKPHQYNPNKQYLIRLDGQNIGAPHYLVEALFKQVKRPELRGYLRVVGYRMTLHDGLNPNTIDLQLEATIFNVSRLVNDTNLYVKLEAEAGSFLIVNGSNQLSSAGGRIVTALNAALIVTSGLPNRLLFYYQISTNELRGLEEQPLKITLAFGGTVSETRFGYYTIEFKPLQSGMFSPNDFGKMFTSLKTLNNLLAIGKQENVPYSTEGQDKEDEKIAGTLGGI